MALRRGALDCLQCVILNFLIILILFSEQACGTGNITLENMGCPYLSHVEKRSALASLCICGDSLESLLVPCTKYVYG